MYSLLFSLLCYLICIHESSGYIGYDAYKQGYPDVGDNYATGYIYDFDENPQTTKEDINEQNQYKVQRQDRHAEHPKRTHPKSTHPKSTHPKRTKFDIFKYEKSKTLPTTKRNFYNDHQYLESINIHRKNMPYGINVNKKILLEQTAEGGLDRESRAVKYINEYLGMFLF